MKGVPRGVPPAGGLSRAASRLRGILSAQTHCATSSLFLHDDILYFQSVR